MTITQTIDVPADRRITVPHEVPTGTVIFTFTPSQAEPQKVPVFGCLKGQIKMSDDFDAPLEDFKEYM
ncbi:MAG: DUF2281 domain-containing protein [Treponema sp.]|nr:DUF2281 domain-containing protein [Treponema sp.]